MRVLFWPYLSGATIKRIQQQTHTYIVTPSRDKEPVFEVTGMPENVDRAREEIEAHIAMRTGGLIELQDENDFHANGTDVGFDLHGHATLWSKPSAGMTPTSVRKSFSNYRNDSSSSLGSASTDSYFGNNSSRMADYSPPSPALSYTTSNNNGNNNNNNISVNTNGNGFVYGSEAISPDCTDLTFDSPGFDSTPAQPGILWSQYDSRMTPSSTGSTPRCLPLVVNMCSTVQLRDLDAKIWWWIHEMDFFFIMENYWWVTTAEDLERAKFGTRFLPKW